MYVLDETCGQWIKKYTTQPIVAEGLRLPQCLTTGQIVVETWERGDSDHRSTFFYDPSICCLSAKFDASNTLWYQSYSHVESLVCLKGMEPLEKEAKEDKKKKKKPKKKNWYVHSIPLNFKNLFVSFKVVLDSSIFYINVLETTFFKKACIFIFLPVLQQLTDNGYQLHVIFQ